VAKPEWGGKRECPSCGTRYYDLGKEPPVCPRCGTALTAAAIKAAAPAAPAAEKTKPKPEPRVAPAEEGDEAEAPIAGGDHEGEFVDDEEEFVEEEAEEETFEPEPEEK
jgi:uncharacterized protein (TIGR02300 family)